MRIILLEPEIPQNTGNIARLSVALGAELWLVGRLGFSLTEKSVRRAGMDYWKDVKLTRLATVEEFYPLIDEHTAFISTKTDRLYTSLPSSTESLVFGSESSGLPSFIYNSFADKLYRIPMTQGTRSLNLSSAAAIVSYHLANCAGFNNLFDMRIN